jgi:hypothetical protein
MVLVGKIPRDVRGRLALRAGLAAWLIIAIPSLARALSVTETNDPAVLVNSILGPGISVVGTPTYSGAATAAGTFSQGTASGVGFESGIILTTGQASEADGPNQFGANTTAHALPGDPELSDLIGGTDTYDAAALEFSFTTDTSQVFFNFAFASEEYLEYVGQEYNDVFGFFLDGANIGLIPGTTTPVAINNVNHMVNSAFYINNVANALGLPVAGADIEYDGFTTVFTAQALDLSAGPHTIRLAIADAYDESFDSGVFIQGGTFAGSPVPEPSALPLMGMTLWWVARRARGHRDS